jgi:5-methylcytosine-specific restriction endonuclease McrA
MLIMLTESTQFDALSVDAEAFALPRYTDSPRTTRVLLAVANESARDCDVESARVTQRRFSEVGRLPSDEVARQVTQLNQHHQRLSAELLLYLGELEGRRLFRHYACSSLFEYLTSRLGQSEDVAYRWMWGARLMRTYPLVYELLAAGRLHLSALMLLKPHLTEQNHREWLLAASGQSKRQVERLVAARDPRPDVPTKIRRLPDPALIRHAEPGHLGYHPIAEASPSSGVTAPMAVTSASDDAAPMAVTSAPSTMNESSTAVVAPEPQVAVVAPMAVTSAPSTMNESSTAVVAPHSLPNCFDAKVDKSSRATKIQPLSEHSYRVVFTASQRLKDKFERASELLSHTLSPNDLPAMLERALDLLIAREDRRRYGSPRPRSLALSNEDGDSSLPLVAPSAIPSTELSAPQQATALRELSAPQQATALTELSAPQQATTLTELSAPQQATTLTELSAPPTRYLPSRVRRLVWERDGGQCTYVDAEGRRCCSRRRIEFDHYVAHALGGEPSPDNVRLRCRCHNALAAEQVFGVERIAETIATARERRRRPGTKVLGTEGSE